MCKTMKSFVMTIIAVVLLSLTSMAQFKVGGGLWYGSDINTVGISIDGKYEFTEEWSGSGRYTYFFDSDINWSSLDFDANYFFYTIEDVGSFYGIAGIDFLFFSYDFEAFGISGDVSDTFVGFNLGAGFEYELTDQLDLYPEMRYTFGDGNYFRIGASLLYSF